MFLHGFVLCNDLLHNRFTKPATTNSYAAENWFPVYGTVWWTLPKKQTTLHANILISIDVFKFDSDSCNASWDYILQCILGSGCINLWVVIHYKVILCHIHNVINKVTSVWTSWKSSTISQISFVEEGQRKVFFEN